MTYLNGYSCTTYLLKPLACSHTFRPVTYTNWGAGQALVPRNVTTRGCVAAVGQAIKSKNYQGGFWYDYDCNKKLRALCRITDKKPPKNVTVYPGTCPGVSTV